MWQQQSRSAGSVMTRDGKPLSGPRVSRSSVIGSGPVVSAAKAASTASSGESGQPGSDTVMSTHSTSAKGHR